jgi:Fe-S cluster assembly iron-binding protein IscA
MIMVSDQAAEVLLESLQQSGIAPEEGLRLKAIDNGCELALDSPTEGDRVIERDGSTLIIVQEELDAAIGEAVIDVQDTPNGLELTLRKATGT